MCSIARLFFWKQNQLFQIAAEPHLKTPNPEDVETHLLPTLTHCFPRDPAAAGSLIPLAPIRRGVCKKRSNLDKMLRARAR